MDNRLKKNLTAGRENRGATVDKQCGGCTARCVARVTSV